MSYTDSTGAMIIATDDADVSACTARNETDRLKLTVANDYTRTGRVYLTEADARDLGKFLTDWADGYA